MHRFHLWYILGAVLLIYGLSMSPISGKGFFIVWVFLSLGCFFAGFMRHKEIWKLLPGWTYKLFVALIVLFLASLVIIEIPIIRAFGLKGQQKADKVLVLGAQLRADGPSRLLKYRLDAAYDYLSTHPEAICIVSGGKGADEPVSEAQGMHDYLAAKGLEEGRIIMEDRSESTVENIRNSKAWIAEDDSVLVVTNNFHLFRAMGIARAAGLENVSGIAAKSTPWYLPNYLLREYFGVIKDLVFGNMKWN